MLYSTWSLLYDSDNLLNYSINRLYFCHYMFNWNYFLLDQCFWDRHLYWYNYLLFKLYIHVFLYHHWYYFLLYHIYIYFSILNNNPWGLFNVMYFHLSCPNLTNNWNFFLYKPWYLFSL